MKNATQIGFRAVFAIRDLQESRVERGSVHAAMDGALLVEIVVAERCSAIFELLSITD